MAYKGIQGCSHIIYAESSLSFAFQWFTDGGRAVQAHVVQDMLLGIELDHVMPQVWRRFRISGGISLRTLQDKVCLDNAHLSHIIMQNMRLASWVQRVLPKAVHSD